MSSAESYNYGFATYLALPTYEIFTDKLKQCRQTREINLFYFRTGFFQNLLVAFTNLQFTLASDLRRLLSVKL